MLRLLTAVAALSLAVFPAAAHASAAQTVVSADKRWVVFDAAPGEVNRLLVEVSTNSRVVRLSDPAATIAPGPGCQADAAGRVLCRIDAGVRLVQADLADGADRADVVTPNAPAAQVDVAGGPDDDLIRGRGASRLNFSGNEGDDQLSGSDGRDILRGQAGDDFLGGRGGNDLLIGDAGDDVLRAGLGLDRLFGGAGADKLDARDRPALADSVVDCGTGADLTTEDRLDRPQTRRCETVKF